MYIKVPSKGMRLSRVVSPISQIYPACLQSKRHLVARALGVDVHAVIVAASSEDALVYITTAVRGRRSSSIQGIDIYSRENYIYMATRH